ncbi:MAG: DUF1018 domain-containing protein [Nitrospirae bacterium]|nr:DUF1018 domain-containing protein [Nitrospirota bacterium]
MNNPLKNLKSSEAISKKQMRAIWALSNRLGLQEEDLHARVESISGKKSIRALTKSEARHVIEDLLLLAGSQKRGSEKSTLEKGKVTQAQMDFIYETGRKIGWKKEHIFGLAKKMYRVSQLKNLRVEQASGLIEALKAIQNRNIA